MDINAFISSGILEEYVMGQTSEEDNQLVQKYATEYPEVKAELDQISHSLEQYANAYAIEPSSFVKEQLFKKINETKGSVTNDTVTKKVNAPVYKINAFLKFAAAASFFLFLLSSFYNYTLYNKYQNSKTEIASVKEELESQKQVALDMNREMSVVKNKMAMPVVLNGTPHSPQSVAKIFWMKNTGDVYVDPSNLPSLPSDKQYQLWAIVDSKPVDGGMISTKNGDIFHMQKMHSFGKAQAFAITIEKAGGSPTPTMDEMVVIAKI